MDGVSGLAFKSGALHGRLPDGDALKMLQLSWEGADPSAGPPGQIKRARVELETVEDFAILKRAISAISESGDDARDALSDMPLRRIALVGRLPKSWECRKLPAVVWMRSICRR